MIGLIEKVDESVHARRQRAGELLEWLRGMSGEEKRAVQSALQKAVGEDNGQGNERLLGTGLSCDVEWVKS